METDVVVEAGPNLLARTLSRRWRAILAVGLLGAILATGSARFWLAPTYQVLSLLRFEPPVDGTTCSVVAERIIDEIKAAEVLAASRVDPALIGRGESLRERLEIRLVTGAFLIEVGLISPSPAEASAVVNEVVEAYLATIAPGPVEEVARKQVGRLEELLQSLDVDRNEVERRWRNLAAKGNLDTRAFERILKDAQGVDPVDPDGRVAQAYKRTTEEIETARLDLTEAAAWLDLVKAYDRKPAPEPPGEKREKPRTPTDFRELAQRIHDERAGSALLRRLLTRDATPLELEQDARQAQAKVDAILNRIRLGQGKLRQLDQENKRRATDELELVLLTQRREMLRAKQETVSRRIEWLKFDLKNPNPANVQRVCEATPPAHPYSDGGRGFAVLALPALAMLASLALFTGVEASARQPKPDPLA
jgi:uncharacterized protein involved in exopolysaccharide biosynthesis